MTVPSLTSVFDRLDLGNVFRPIAGTAFKPIGGVCPDWLARKLGTGLSPLEGLPPTPKERSRQVVADKIRAATVTVPIERELTEWELERLADAWVTKTKRKRHRASAAVGEGDDEIVDPNVCVPGEPEVNEFVEGRNARAVAELPSETMLKAIKLLKKFGLRTYTSTRMANVVEQWVLQAEMLKLAETFDEAKKALREWLKAQPQPPKPQGKRKNGGQLPAMSTLNQVINSLEPIYQELRGSMRSKLAADSEVTKAA